MNGRFIPGFYYDPDKGKYFKIANPSDAPTASQYTKDVVQRLKHENVAQKRQKQRTIQERKQRVQHPKVLRSPLLYGAGFEREMFGVGRGIGATSVTSLAYGNWFVEDTEYFLMVSYPYRPKLFAWDKGTGGFLIGMSTGHETSWLGSQKEFDPWRPWDSTELGTSVLASYRSDISSISISQSRKALVTTLGGRENAGAHFMTLLDPEPSSLDHGPTFDMQTRIEWQDEDSIWSSAASPFDNESATFAVGSKNKLCLFSDAENFKPTQLMSSTSDILAVSWLNPSTIVAGQRDGKLYLYDRRSGGNSLRLRQHSAVVGLRCPNDASVVSCGTQDSLVMYDLRMARDNETIIRHSKRRKREHDIKCTAPVIRYRYNNRSTTAVGFDISVGTGLVAAADDKYNVQLYSLWSGERAKELLISTDKTNPWSYRKPVQYVEFVQEYDEDILMAGTGGGIVRLTWKNCQDIDY